MKLSVAARTYGYKITRRLNALGFTDVVDGTIYTILVRLEKNNLVDIEKKPSDMGPPRKFLCAQRRGTQRTAAVLGKMGVRIIKNKRVKGDQTMTFWEKITGNDMTKELQIF